jgi:hypothetical protein
MQLESRSKQFPCLARNLRFAKDPREQISGDVAAVGVRDGHGQLALDHDRVAAL